METKQLVDKLQDTNDDLYNLANKLDDDKKAAEEAKRRKPVEEEPLLAAMKSPEEVAIVGNHVICIFWKFFWHWFEARVEVQILNTNKALILFSNMMWYEGLVYGHTNMVWACAIGTTHMKCFSSSIDTYGWKIVKWTVSMQWMCPKITTHNVQRMTVMSRLFI